ncbi:phage/plasmid primase, P4 family [Nocardioides ochotonae]|uniref:phage/plasmid primase, P4 family n=1 Tax=Nocardioides ochotonae TaxID=2685869 RepID=UPI00174D1B1F|nr:phage/plasmid primase, P4 family [Nocardioides ochotonae]
MTLDDLISRFDVVEHDPDGYRVHCPAHHDTDPSLRITVSEKGAVLVKCRAGCPTATVVAQLGLTMRDLATMTAGDSLDFRRATSTDRPASPADVARLAVDLDRWSAALADCPEVQDYAARRFGLTPADMERLGLGAADDLPGGVRLVVPFRDPDGVARGFQARALKRDAAVRWFGPRSPEGASWAKVAYFPGGANWDEVLITEGPGDSLTGAALGYDTIGVRGAGLASNPAVVEAIADMLDDRLAVICGDGDPAGRTFATTLSRELLARGKRVKVLPVPDDHDLTDWREVDPVRFPAQVIRAITDTREETTVAAVLRERDETRYPLTDLGNAYFARDFIAARGSGVKYSPEVGFFLLHGGVWRHDRLDRTRSLVQAAAQQVAELAADLSAASLAEPENTTKARVARHWAGWARYSQSSRGIESALKELAALRDVAMDVNDFDRHPDLLAVANGVVDLRTGALRPHDPALLLTRRVEVDYDPDARCPRWDAFLREIFPAHPDLPDFMRRWVGYGITGRTDEQAFAVLWGTGANGKSVLTDTLTEVFRELTVTTPFSTFEEKSAGGIPNDLAALKGARLVMASEGDQGRPMAEAVLKRVTGRDLIAARFMRKEFFEFRPTFALMLATNYKPNFRGQDEGLWRRVKLVPFERYFAPHERDHRLGDTLLGERAGILAWAVRGAVEWFARGLEDPEVIRHATAEYRETSNALAGFLPGVFVVEDGERLTGKALFDAYLEWADEENLPGRERWTRRTFFAALEERGLVKRRAAAGVVFEGVRRARAADREEVGVTRAGQAPLAHSPTDTATAPGGPSLFDV